MILYKYVPFDSGKTILETCAIGFFPFIKACSGTWIAHCVRSGNFSHKCRDRIRRRSSPSSVFAFLAADARFSFGNNFFSAPTSCISK